MITFARTGDVPTYRRSANVKYQSSLWTSNGMVAFPNQHHNHFQTRLREEKLPLCQSLSRDLIRITQPKYVYVQLAKLVSSAPVNLDIMAGAVQAFPQGQRLPVDCFHLSPTSSLPPPSPFTKSHIPQFSPQRPLATSHYTIQTL